MKKKIRVTRGHIAAGRRADARRCPLARALRDAIGPDVAVMGTVFEHRGVDIGLPAEASDFVFRWDARRPVSPFSFTIDLPAPERKSGT